VFQRTLSGALDPDTFVVVNKRIEADSLPKQTIRLFASAESDAPALRSNLVPPSTRTVALVDRTANMPEAASAILRARFAFGGKSPFAPDLVLVNEFSVKEFCASIAEAASKFFAVQVEMNGSTSTAAAEKARAARVSSHELDQAGADVLISGSKGSVVRVNDRKSKLLRKRLQEPLVVIHPVRSMDDAIEFANIDSEEPLAGLYTFADPAVAKYTSQFIDAHLCCVNSIPVEIFVGPRTPVGYPTTLSGPYSKDMFCLPKPGFIQYGDKAAKVQKLLSGNDVKQAATFRQQAESQPVEVKQPAGHAIGFFEQGILLGLGMVVTTIVAGNVVFWRYGFPAIRTRLGH
jgi:hypothetical protein